MDNLGKITSFWWRNNQQVLPGRAGIKALQDHRFGIVMVKTDGSRELIPWDRIERVRYV